MARAIGVLLALAVVLTGCSAPSTALPAGITVSVFQTRFDGALHQLQIRVANGTADALEVTGATFESSRFAEPASFDRAQTVPAGSARDLPVLLGDPECGDEPIRDAVELSFSRADGSPATAVVVLEETDIVTAINEKDCLDAAVASHATITPPAAASWTPGAGAPAQLDFTVTPTAAPGTLTVRSARDTPLLSLVDDSGSHVTELRLDAVIDADSGAVLLRLLVEPSRCDPHAIAEDKQGTLFPFDVDTSDGRAGRIVVPVSDDVRSSLYDFFADYCGLPY
ncbi:hypothetical protein [Antiquaquibacter soli]|uniref:Uncharacterized protein n=1 Tax=Antiquaquibacter soli TaxID=3064523 RepID=A0ABT9BNT4_9MICO|nr:hypothetical protein [Protaetiibacter sp. WY-16]MDO7881456.1 hypothetical protein [Protaetiibacter sp. WY-16]